MERRKLMRKNYELELYKLIVNPDEEYVEEFGWVSDTEFVVWVDTIWFYEFIKQLKEIFDYEIFDEGGFEARIGSDYVCIDLTDVLSGYGINFEKAFPKSKYKH